MTTELTPPIALQKSEDLMEYIKRVYFIFQRDLNNRDNRPTLLGKFIYIDGTPSYFNMINSFWHLGSIRSDDLKDSTNKKYDMDPCINDVSSGECLYGCDLNHPQNFMKEEDSVPCIFRLSRIVWIKEILELFIKEPKNRSIKVWKQKNSRTKENSLKVRYINGHVDYVIIFKITHNKDKTDIQSYRLITAYPVVLKSYKKRFDKEYEDYKNKRKGKK